MYKAKNTPESAHPLSHGHPPPQKTSPPHLGSRTLRYSHFTTMGAGASKAARRLPTKAPTTTTSGSADAAMRAGRAAAAEQAAADAQQSQQAQQQPRGLEYGSQQPQKQGIEYGRPPRAEDAPFSGEKDDRGSLVGGADARNPQGRDGPPVPRQPLAHGAGQGARGVCAGRERPKG